MYICTFWVEAECHIESDPGGIRSVWQQGVKAEQGVSPWSHPQTWSHPDLISIGTLFLPTRYRITVSPPQEPPESVSGKREP